MIQNERHTIRVTVESENHGQRVFMAANFLQLLMREMWSAERGRFLLKNPIDKVMFDEVACAPGNNCFSGHFILNKYTHFVVAFCA